MKKGIALIGTVLLLVTGSARADVETLHSALVKMLPGDWRVEYAPSIDPNAL